MRILVTGASGFLGKHLCDKLRGAGHEIWSIHSKNYDLTKEESLRSIEHLSFDQIYHLAAWTQAGDFCLYHAGEQWLINQKINTNVLHFWKEKQPQAKLIAIGTSCAYDESLPCIEEYYLQGTPIDSLFTYAMTKRMLLSGLIALNRQFGLDFLYLIPSTLYGPGYHTDGRQMHFIFDLIKKILAALYNGTPVILWGDGFQKRELIHIRDFVEAAVTLAAQEKNTWINIGSGVQHSIREFASMICKIAGYSFENISFDLTKYVGARSKVLTIDKLKTVLPNFEPTQLEAGLLETIRWFEKTFFLNKQKQEQDAPKHTCAKVLG